MVHIAALLPLRKYLAKLLFLALRSYSCRELTVNKKFAQEPWIDQDTPPPKAEKESAESTRRKYEWLTGARREKAGESDVKEQPSASIEFQSLSQGTPLEAILSPAEKPVSGGKITLLSYGGMPVLTLNTLPEVIESAPSLTLEGRLGNVSIVAAGPSNDSERSVKLPLGVPWVYVEVTAKGAVSIGIGSGEVVKYLKNLGLEYVGADVYVNLACAEQEKCGDFGLKAKVLNTTIKREGSISFDQGAAYMGEDLSRNIQKWYSNPQ